MVSTLLGEDGANRTAPAFVASVDRLASKYLRSVSFFASGKVITVLLGNPSDFDEYLHILADELPQMADRVLGRRCRIGVSRMVRSLSELHGAYREAMEALRQGDRSEGGAQFISDLAPAVKGGSLLCRLCLCFLRGFAHSLCGSLGEVFPAQVKGGLHGGQRPDDHCCQREEQLVRKQCQPQRKACRRCKRQGMPAPRHFPPAHGTSPPSAK